MEMTPRDRKMLIVLGVVGGLALVYFLGTTLLGGGEDGPIDDTGSPPPVVEPSPGPTPSPTDDAGEPPVLVVGGRDPFSIPPILQTGTPPPGGEGNGNGNGNGNGASPTPTRPGGGTSTTIGGQTVVLLNIFTRDGEQLAQVEVDGEVFTVGEGDTFADNLQLVSISGSCVRFLFGDEGFTLCEQAPK